ncbi:hypothetical protein DEM27_02980 [Metarhizobium album]|uniref:Uncharacterized protein n=2 Tax=Metarhizobium album TaxID=2182425 RepID=A0A2U2DXW8_9HYPH|nr:hypothetical protein DEM27_02980 [Rhizobium album]
MTSGIDRRCIGPLKGRVKSIPSSSVSDFEPLEMRMADVVRIWDRLERLPRQPQTKKFDAQILLFTGVRYERRDLAVTTQDAKSAQPANQH